MNVYCLILNNINIVIEKKDIKYLYISVCLFDDFVYVFCFLVLNDESFRFFLIKRFFWIKE